MRLLSVNRYSIPMRRFQGVKKLFAGGSNPNELPHRKSTTLWNPVLGGRIGIPAWLVTAMPAWQSTGGPADVPRARPADSGRDPGVDLDECQCVDRRQIGRGIPSGHRNCKTSSCEGCEVRFVESE